MRVCVIGEGMLDLSRAGADRRLGHGGDRLDIAIHLARLGVESAWLTASGADPFSHDLKAAWKANGLNPSRVAKLGAAGRLIGAGDAFDAACIAGRSTADRRSTPPAWPRLRATWVVMRPERSRRAAGGRLMIACVTRTVR